MRDQDWIQELISRNQERQDRFQKQVDVWMDTYCYSKTWSMNFCGTVKKQNMSTKNKATKIKEKL